MNDITCFFNSESYADKCFTFLNQRHTKIKLTIEKQTENQLSLLDLLITFNGDNFSFSKKASLSKFYAFFIKIGLLKTLLHQAFVISSNCSFRTE